MSRPKRESMKGKGLGTFFPEPEAEQQTVTAPVLRALPPADEPDANTSTCMHESKHASMQDAPHGDGTALTLGPDSLQASKQVDMLASGQAGTQTRAQASQHASLQAPDSEAEMVVKSESVLATLLAPEQHDDQVADSRPATGDPLVELWPVLAEPATITNAFRFADGELERLGDVVYQISKRHAVKVPKQDVVRLALGAVLLEYEREGEESLLGRYVRRRKQWRRGGE